MLNNRQGDLHGEPLAGEKGFNERARLKPGQSLRLMAPDRAGEILLHPAQQSMVNQVAGLIAALRACDSPEDYYEFQRELGGQLYQIDKRRNECSHSVKRLRKKRMVLPEYSPPVNQLSDELESWQFENLVYERLARQLRSVGDGMAWRCFDYDRRIIMTLSRNDSPGSIYGKEGLPHELGRVKQLWHESGHFGLLHDLTNCLRIADVTEFTQDRGALLHEVKASNHVRKEQTRRAKAAVAAMMNDAPLPGQPQEARVIKVSERYATDLDVLDQAIQRSKRTGCAALGLPHDRAVTCVSLPRMTTTWADDVTSAMTAVGEARDEALALAAIGQTTHHLRANSGDTASRSSFMAPFSIYPFTPEDCAALICDYLVFDSLLSFDGLARRLEELGMQASVLSPGTVSAPAVHEDVLWVQLRDLSVTMPFSTLGTLAFELVRPDTWTRGVRELLSPETLRAMGALVFSDEASVWEALREAPTATEAPSPTTES